MTIGIIGNTLKPAVRKVVPQFIQWLYSRHVPMFIASDLAAHLEISPKDVSIPTNEIPQQCDMVVTFGGDGTMLAAAQIVGRSGVPILGVNLGGLGFLAEILTDELYSCFGDILDGKYQIIERMVLQVTVLNDGKNQEFFALNDAVVEKGGFSRMVKVDISIDNKFFNTYHCDGLIISTPTGSTAYSLSAGGPILVPTMEAMIVTAICPHTLAARPLVIPDSSVVATSVSSQQGPVILNIDGQLGCKLSPQSKVEISRADYFVRWVKSPHKNFYDVLREKLN